MRSFLWDDENNKNNIIFLKKGIKRRITGMDQTPKFEKLKKRCYTAAALSVRDEWGEDTYKVYAHKYNISRSDIEDYAVFVTKFAKTLFLTGAVFTAGILFNRLRKDN